jgi:hypothetical protein
LVPVHEPPAAQAAQLPVASQTYPLPLPQEVPGLSAVQLPVLHEWQSPQAVLQQVPETHWPCVHWAFPEHTLPSAIVGVQAPPEPQ